MIDQVDSMALRRREKTSRTRIKLPVSEISPGFPDLSVMADEETCESVLCQSDLCRPRG